jgi:NAD(P)-dependent dehydrogenase (short-subunit alcohol dehydrogenase family)
VVEQGPEWSTVPLPGSRVLVTEAAGGLGRALSSALAKVGAEVVGIDLPGTEATVTADLTDDDSARRAVADAVERLGGLDALIGAAGVVDTIHRAETVLLKEFRGDIEANLVACATVNWATCRPRPDT